MKSDTEIQNPQILQQIVSGGSQEKLGDYALALLHALIDRGFKGGIYFNEKPVQSKYANHTLKSYCDQNPDNIFNLKFEF